MRKNPALRHPERPLFRAGALIALFATGALLLTGLVGTAAAAPVKKDGRIYACYKVKGKPRGAMRVLFKGKRCKRGERRVAWVAASSPNATQHSGSSGQPGSAGQQGAAGEDDSELSAQVNDLNLKVEGLEAILKGVTNDDLTKAIAATPLVEDICGQVEELTGRSNALLGLLDTLDALNVLSLPLALPAFEVCPEP